MNREDRILLWFVLTIAFLLYLFSSLWLHLLIVYKKFYYSVLDFSIRDILSFELLVTIITIVAITTIFTTLRGRSFRIMLLQGALLLIVCLPFNFILLNWLKLGWDSNISEFVVSFMAFACYALTVQLYYSLKISLSKKISNSSTKGILDSDE